MSTLSGWAAWKGDGLYSADLHRTKKDILIGYDMIPLRGLRQTEKVLKSKGITMERTSVIRCDPESRDGYCLSVRGRLDAPSLSWSITHRGGGVWKVYDPRGHELLTFQSACGYVASSADRTTRIFRGIQFTASELLNLNRIWWGWDLDRSNPSQPRDKRRQSTLAKAWAEARETFARNRLAVVPVKFVRAEATR